MVLPTSRRVVVAVAAAVGAAAGGCGGSADATGRLLELVPSDAELVVAITPAQVTGTWLDDTVSALVEGSVPACVLEVARGSSTVVVGWGAETGALIALPRPARGVACADLSPHGDAVVWVDGLEPGSGSDRFFAGRERRQRWAELDDAPVRALADLELAAGVVVHARGTADPRDGLVARAVVRADDRATQASLRERYVRWRREVDRERMGGAWPAFSAIVTAVDSGDPERATDVVELKLPGEDGATAAALAIGALSAGLGGAHPRLPCPPDLGAFRGQASCSEGELTLDEDLYDTLRDSPGLLSDGVDSVVAMRNGAFVGLRIDALSPRDPLSWLGFANGDIIDAIDGRPLSAGQDLSLIVGRILAARDVEVGVTRRGRHGTLRFRVR